MMPICDPSWPVDGRNYSQSYTALRFRVMRNALLSQNRTILYSLCEWGMSVLYCRRAYGERVLTSLPGTDEPWTWGNATANSWRMSNDISGMDS